MPVQEFEIKDCAALKYVKCTNVPEVMIVTGPNGVGKSTLLEEIATFLRSKRRRNVNIKMSGDPKPVKNTAWGQSLKNMVSRCQSLGLIHRLCARI